MQARTEARSSHGCRKEGRKEAEAEKPKQEGKEQENRDICCRERALEKAIPIPVTCKSYQNSETCPSI